MKNILKISILSGIFSLSLWADCIRNADETVLCSGSKLIWQDDENAKTVSKTWSEAIKYCQNLSLSGHSDWRLPNKNELLSIVDYTMYDPAINSAFKNTSSGNFWSSTSDSSLSNGPWVIGFSDGNTGYGPALNAYYIRCVRAGQ